VPFGWGEPRRVRHSTLLRVSSGGSQGRRSGFDHVAMVRILNFCSPVAWRLPEQRAKERSNSAPCSRGTERGQHPGADSAYAVVCTGDREAESLPSSPDWGGGDKPA